MSEIYVSKEKFPEAVGQLMSLGRVYGPVLQGRYHELVRLAKPEEIDLNYRNTRFSPKGIFHPHGERMFTYTLDRNDPECGIYQEASKDYSAQVILGIRPCDARALQLDDKNFDTETVKDPWWVQRRACTTLVGLACNNPCGTCFCTSMDTGPFDDSGLDVLMADVGDGYVARSVTGKGQDLIARITGAQAVSSQASEKEAQLKNAAEEGMGRVVDLEPVYEKNTLELFNDALWEEVQFACINCGTCTFVCPTCWCFDIQDEVQGDKGERIKMWDSCMFPLFTFHGSGHNPRQNKIQRVRQRFMHKLKYYPEKYGNGAACVGCGRCVQSCPVNIDIRHVVRLMSAGCSCPA